MRGITKPPGANPQRIGICRSQLRGADGRECISGPRSLLGPLASSLDPSALRQIVDFRISADVQARVDYLAKLANEGALSPDEDAEYEALIDGADLIAILKLKARRVLAA